MTPFTQVTGRAAPLLRDNIDTDVIIRVERLAGTTRASMADYAFEAWRFRPDGTEDPDFVLNRPAYRGAPILVTGANFGCGSSREGAVWALMGLGVRCVIAGSFGDIFASNCFENGVLPLVMPEPVRRQLAGCGNAMTVDLVAQTISAPGGVTIPLSIEPGRREYLISGLDAIALTRSYRGQIEIYQARDQLARPWAWIDPAHDALPCSGATQSDKPAHGEGNF